MTNQMRGGCLQDRHNASHGKERLKLTENASCIEEQPLIVYEYVIHAENNANPFFILLFCKYRIVFS